MLASSVDVLPVARWLFGRYLAMLDHRCHRRFLFGGATTGTGSPIEIETPVAPRIITKEDHGGRLSRIVLIFCAWLYFRSEKE